MFTSFLCPWALKYAKVCKAKITNDEGRPGVIVPKYSDGRKDIHYGIDSATVVEQVPVLGPFSVKSAMRSCFPSMTVTV